MVIDEMLAVAVFPAPAGMNRCCAYGAGSTSSVPRASGDEPGYWTDDARVKIVFPAPAGMNRCPTYSSSRCKSVPRASGDEPIQDYANRLVALCSPRQRG